MPKLKKSRLPIRKEEIEQKSGAKANLRGGGQGPSVAEMMRDEGLIMEPGDNDRFLGKQQMHERLKVAEDGLPLIQIYSSCTAFLRTVPVLPLDDKEDIDTDTEDHVWDECRYFLMSRPVVPRKPKPEKERYWATSRGGH